MPFDQFLFRHFWTTLSLAGGLAQWLVWAWLLSSRGVAIDPVLWAAAPLALAVVFRLATRVLQTESEIHTTAERICVGVVAAGFIGLIAAGTLGAGLVAWTGLGWLASVPAQASALPMPAPLGDFRPIGGTILLATVAALTWGYLEGYRRLRVQELTLALPNLPTAFEGYRIAHVSDIHLGPLADRAALREAFACVAGLAPDLVCVTGDIVDTPNADVDAWMPELRRLDAPDGVVAILGNHDHHAGLAKVVAGLARHTTWRLLRDEIAEIRRGAAVLRVVGHDDGRVAEGSERLRRLWTRVPSDVAAVLLIHHPHLFDAAAAAGVPVTLAGHTHGGQLAIPGLPQVNVARILGLRYDRGLIRRGRSTLHVSRGLGTSGQRVRVGVPRDVTIVRLVAAG